MSAAVTPSIDNWSDEVSELLQRISYEPTALRFSIPEIRAPDRDGEGSKSRDIDNTSLRALLTKLASRIPWIT
ncbi:hypothetical protein FRB94_011305, partial [Tulasnella sp. JGI-2019a]